MDIRELIRNAKNLTQEANIQEQHRGTMIGSLTIAQLLLDREERLELQAGEGEGPIENLQGQIDDLRNSIDKMTEVVDEALDATRNQTERLDDLEDRIEDVEEYTSTPQPDVSEEELGDGFDTIDDDGEDSSDDESSGGDSGEHVDLEEIDG